MLASAPTVPDTRRRQPAVPESRHEAHPLADLRIGVSIRRAGARHAAGDPAMPEWMCDVPPGQSVGLNAEWDIISVWNVSWGPTARCDS
ncbi:hypothetical protein WOLCODRAFT_152610 [Wolfiporia cocos MD-104 SS10]|uniref:Uncharacterized protein n=1 Tax=Wolfiporia cocos (strain MD-104) TaxID=742152 RepID=A0A2H3JK55_WOLCO|nr:hypothetical protein WOLCODRAFT_152610 [Wolfiporia cocos MD-104 SS10]